MQWPQQHNNLLRIHQLIAHLPFPSLLADETTAQTALAVCGQEDLCCLDCHISVHYGHQISATYLGCSSYTVFILQFNTWRNNTVEQLGPLLYGDYAVHNFGFFPAIWTDVSWHSCHIWWATNQWLRCIGSCNMEETSLSFNSGFPLLTHVQPFFLSAQFSILLILSRAELHIWNPRTCVELPVCIPVSTVQTLVYVDLSSFRSLSPAPSLLNMQVLLLFWTHIHISMFMWYLHRLNKHNSPIRQYVPFSEKEYSILLH